MILLRIFCLSLLWYSSSFYMSIFWRLGLSWLYIEWFNSFTSCSSQDPIEEAFFLVFQILFSSFFNNQGNPVFFFSWYKRLLGNVVGPNRRRPGHLLPAGACESWSLEAKILWHCSWIWFRVLGLAVWSLISGWLIWKVWLFIDIVLPN